MRTPDPARPPRTYEGWRVAEDGRMETGGPTRVRVLQRVTWSGERRVVSRALRLVRPTHSPGGFEWSYAGSGPAELARQLLRDCLGPHMLDRPDVYQAFKFAYVARWGERWRITEREIRDWYATWAAAHPDREEAG